MPSTVSGRVMCVAIGLFDLHVCRRNRLDCLETGSYLFTCVWMRIKWYVLLVASSITRSHNGEGPSWHCGVCAGGNYATSVNEYTTDVTNSDVKCHGIRCTFH